MDTFKSALIGYRNMLTLEQAFAESKMVGDEDKVGPLEDVKITFAAKTPLADFFIAKLKENGPMTKDELRRSAMEAGYFEPGESGGRTTHVTLVNISRNNRISNDGDRFSVMQTEDSLL